MDDIIILFWEDLDTIICYVIYIIIKYLYIPLLYYVPI